MKGRFLARLKQSISALLALVMALALVPMSALATGNWGTTDEAGTAAASFTADEQGKAKFKVTTPDADTKNYYIYDKLDSDANQYYLLATVADTTITLVTDENVKNTANVSNIELASGVFTATLKDKTKDATLAVGLENAKFDFTIKAYEEVQAAPKVTFTLTDAKGATVTAVTNATKATGETGDIYTVTDKTKPVTFKLDTSAVTNPENYDIAVKAGSDPLTDTDGVYSLTTEADVTVTVTLTEKAPVPVTTHKVTIKLPEDKSVTMGTNTLGTPDKTTGDYTVNNDTAATFKLTVAESVEKAYVLTVKVGSDPETAEALEASAEGVYTLEKSTADVLVTVTLTYLPEAEVDKDAGVENATKAEVSKDQVDGLTALITGNATVEGTENNKSVTVEPGDEGKALVFDGTAGDATTKNNGHKVELPKELTEALTGEAKADVKVNSGVGSVTVPSDALTGAKASVTISVVKKSYTEDEAKKLTFKNDKGVALSDALKNTLTAAIKAVSGLTIEAKAGTENMFKEENAETNKELTITIKVEKAGKYFVLCTSARDGVTTFSREPFDVKADKDGNCFLKFKSRHLSDAVAVEATDAVTAAVKDLALDKSATEPEKPVETKEIKAEYWTEGLPVGGTPTKSLFGAKLAFTNLESGAVYVVQLAKQGQYGTAGCVVMTVKADGNGKAVIDVLPSKAGTTYEVMLFKCNRTDGTVSSLKDLDYTTCNGKDGSKAERAIATLTETMPTAG